MRAEVVQRVQEELPVEAPAAIGSLFLALAYFELVELKALQEPVAEQRFERGPSPIESRFDRLIFRTFELRL